MTFNLLAFETSSTMCDVALLNENSGQVSVVSAHAEGGHAEHLLPMAEQLLSRAGVKRQDLNAIAFGQGPGGFTGLRVACGVAQGIAYALTLPVIPVPSLRAAAAASGPIVQPGVVRVVVQDARMQELYVAAYWSPFEPESDRATWQEIQGCVLVGVDDFAYWLDQQARIWLVPGPIQHIELVGDGLGAQVAHLHEGVLAIAGEPYPLQLGHPVRSNARVVALQGFNAFKAGQQKAPQDAAPLYVRDKVAFTTHERRQGMGGNPRIGSALQLVPMQELHLDQVAEIEARVQSYPWTRVNFADALQAGYGAWVALQEEKVVGFSVSMFAPDVAQLLVIAVAPALQRSGVGYVLLRRCEQAAREHKLSSLLLEVRPSNRQAVHFYQNRGFEPLSVRKGYYPAGPGKREDALVLQKKLSYGKQA